MGLDARAPLTSAEPGGPAAPQDPWPGFLERFAPAYAAELDAFLAVARGELANPCDGREALAALRIAEACEVSRRERRPVRLAEIPGG
ncbi:Gfo/Idh/MocA family oxidoreductase [Actinomadura keratinilytica]